MAAAHLFCHAAVYTASRFVKSTASRFSLGFREVFASKTKFNQFLCAAGALAVFARFSQCFRKVFASKQFLLINFCVPLGPPPAARGPSGTQKLVRTIQRNVWFGGVCLRMDYGCGLRTIVPDVLYGRPVRTVTSSIRHHVKYAIMFNTQLY